MLSSILITAQATCVTVTSTYREGVDQPSTRPPPGVRLLQRRGCPAGWAQNLSIADDEADIRIVDDDWDVHAIGPPTLVDDLIGAMSVVPFAPTSASGPAVSSFDPTVYLDAWFRDHPGAAELGRAAWRGGEVGLTGGRSPLGPRTSLSVEVVPALAGEHLNAGSSGVECRDFATKVSGTTRWGYIAIITTDRVARAHYVDGGTTREVPLLAAKQPGYRYAFVGDPPLPTDPNLAVGVAMTYFDDTGAALPCIQ
jgi:hypothetical protein